MGNFGAERHETLDRMVALLRSGESREELDEDCNVDDTKTANAVVGLNKALSWMLEAD